MKRTLGKRPNLRHPSTKDYRFAAMGIAGLSLGTFTVACTLTYDAGTTRSHGLLPVDERNPIVVLNDGAYDNWATEYALLLSANGGPELAGIIVGTSGPWPEIELNVAGARELVRAARMSGLANIPDPIASIGEVLERPTGGALEDTQSNRSEGALFIIEASKRLALPYRPLVVAVGGRLTDVADAYLIDPTVSERIVVIASLGSLTSSGATMGPPNGEMDPWADLIVATRLPYIQVSAFYDQVEDVPSTRLSELPDNAFGTWIAAKSSRIWSIPEAADQVSVAAVGVPDFVTDIARIEPVRTLDSNAVEGPVLETERDAAGWLVRQVEGTVATQRFWAILSDPETFDRKF